MRTAYGRRDFRIIPAANLLPRTLALANDLTETNPAPSPVTVSVVICTRNRCRVLTRSLDYLERVRFDRSRCELVIVDNGSTDETATVIEQFRAGSSWKITSVYEERPGLGLARNAGVAASTGSLVAFTDDDCYVRDDYLDRIANAFDDSTIGYIGGRIVLHDPSDAPVTVKLDPDGCRIAPYTFLWPGVIHGANFAARRSLLLGVGGFDPMFGAGQPFACEDIDFLVRASLHGWTGAYVPDVVVAHHHGRKPGPDLDRLGRTYARARGAFYAKFLLNSAARRQCAQTWYWTALPRIKSGDFAPVLQELRGAFQYIFQRRRHQRRRPVEGR